MELINQILLEKELCLKEIDFVYIFILLKIIIIIK